jgi:CDP-diacylglycerol--glycerol-3-phosphate 3-phosphatidyltransferase
MTETTSNGPRGVALEASGWLVAAGAFLAGLGALVAESDGGTAPVTPAVVVVTLWTALAAYLVVTVSATPDGRAGGTLGLANSLTVARGGLYAVVAAFVTVPPTGRLAWVPAVCYGVGVVFDRLDGSVARTIGRETTLGRRLDMAFDSFGFVAAPLLAVAWGQLPVYYLSLSAARYVYRAGKYQRRLRGLPLYGPPESDLGRYLAGGQMVFLTIVMTPVVPPEPVALVAPLALAPSLGVFGRDYLFVSGRLPTGDEVSE